MEDVVVCQKLAWPRTPADDYRVRLAIDDNSLWWYCGLIHISAILLVSPDNTDPTSFRAVVAGNLIIKNGIDKLKCIQISQHCSWRLEELLAYSNAAQYYSRTWPPSHLSQTASHAVHITSGLPSLAPGYGGAV